MAESVESTDSTEAQLDESKGKKLQLTSGKDKVQIGMFDSMLVVQINNTMVIVDNDDEFKKATAFFKSL